MTNDKRIDPKADIRLPVAVVGSRQDIGEGAAAADKDSEAKYICTHDGAFHCDDVTAVAMLLFVPEFQKLPVVRSRKQPDFDDATVVIDVGGVYDPSKFRFDHHQRGFDEKYDEEEPWSSKLSSAGMVWKYFGKRILHESFGVSEADSPIVAREIYRTFLHAIDAIDNGVDISADKPRYLERTNLTSRIARCNLRWDDTRVDHVASAEFLAAVARASEEFLEQLVGAIELWLPARKIVKEALDRRADTHPSKRVIELLGHQCPWQVHLSMLEEEEKLDDSNNILFILYKSWGDEIRVQTVRKSLDSFEFRLGLPEKLRGVAKEQLDEIAGFPGVTFVHNAGFIGGAVNREAAVKLVDLALTAAGSGGNK